MTFEQASELLNQWTKGPALLHHAHTVSHVMRMYAKKFGEDQEVWSATGLLHDADYESHPDQHPQLIVNHLNEIGETDMAYAISAHYTKWGNPAKSLLDKALLACDELTGFIVACSYVRPEGFKGMKARSVIKKLKQKSFAAKVDRDEIQIGTDLLDIPLTDHIEFIIEALQDYQLTINN